MKEAFARFRLWRKSNTVLKVTMLVEGEEPQVLVGQITATDEDVGLVGFAILRSRRLLSLDVNDASFQIGKRVIEAQRAEDRLIFEEEQNEHRELPS